jgi:hypothetical protein
LAALCAGRISRIPGYLGVLFGITGILTMIPTITEAMFMIFGPGMMIWSGWMGIVLIHNTSISPNQTETKKISGYEHPDKEICL